MNTSSSASLAEGPPRANVTGQCGRAVNAAEAAVVAAGGVVNRSECREWVVRVWMRLKKEEREEGGERGERGTRIRENTILLIYF